MQRLDTDDSSGSQQSLRGSLRASLCVRRRSIYFVSKNGLTLIQFFAIEFKTGREWSRKPAKCCERLFAAPILFYLEFPLPGDTDLDFIALFQIQCFHHSSWKPHGKAIAPF